MKEKRRIGSVLVITMVLLGATFSIGNSAQKPHAGMKVIAALQSLPSTTYLTEELPAFEAETGMDVELLFLPEIELWDKIAIDVSTGVGAYNVVGMDPMFMAEFAEAKWILPIESYVREWEGYELNDIMLKYLELNQYRGKLYSLPVYGEVTIVWYRKDLLEQIGLEPPDTLVDYWMCAAKLDENTPVSGIAMRGQRGSSMNMFIWTTFLRAMGGKFFDERWNPVFNSPEGIRAAEYYRDILKKYGLPGGGTFGWDDVASVYAMGKVGMILDSIDFLDRVVDPQKSKIMGKIGCAPVPRGPGGRHPAIFTLSMALSAPGNRTLKQREASLAFMRWATSKEMEMNKAFKAHIPTPTRRSVFDDPRFINKYGEEAYPGWRRSYLTDLEIASPDFRPRLPEWREFGDQIGIAIEKIVTGIASPEEGLNQSAEELIKIFERSGRL